MSVLLAEMPSANALVAALRALRERGYRDLDARLSRLIDLLRAAKELVNGIFDIYVSHVSHHTNNVMKILTMVSTILLPSTLIFAFFSTDSIACKGVLQT